MRYGDVSDVDVRYTGHTVIDLEQTLDLWHAFTSIGEDGQHLALSAKIASQAPLSPDIQKFIQTVACTQKRSCSLRDFASNFASNLPGRS